MKQETNNEMDLLLRRLGRSAADASKDGDHLDADELSSYAENALPDAARARYSEHLAECANCRKLVAQLSSSVSVVSAAAKVSEPSALKKFLASLFTPIVLRYAVPALGLIVVAVIGFTVLRQNEPRESVAQLKELESKATPLQPEKMESPAPGNIASRGYIDSPQATPEGRGERAKESQPTPSPNASSSGRVAAQANEAAPVAQAEPPPPASTPAEPKPVTATDEVQKKAEPEVRKEEITNRSASARPAPAAAADSAKREDRKSDNDFMAGRAAAPAAGRASIAKLRRERTEEKDNNDAETRSVAGRRFRRERGVWIDTDYDSSRSPISLARGSEQYRALVADEPTIKTIAEQLDGEIIVVWKGRAYRIR